MRDEETLAKCAAFRLRNAGQKTVPLYLAEVANNWAAPQARDHFPPHSPERIAAKKAEGHGMRNLNDEAATWRAPSDISKRGGSQPAEKRMAGGHSVNLEDQAEHWMAPNVPNGGRCASHAEQVGNTLYAPDGKKVQLGLEHQARQWMTPMTADTGEKVTHATKQYSLIQQAGRDFHPPSSPDQPIAGGSMSSTDGPNSNQPSQRRKLNPIFVEALMRWPTGLSGFERQETAWTRWLLAMPSFVSQLCSTKPRDQGELF